MAVISVLASALVVVQPAAVASEPPHPRFAPSTKGIIVWTHRTEDETSEQLLVARADGSHEHALTPAVPDRFDVDAQVSPNGRWVAYVSVRPDSELTHLIRSDGTGQHTFDVGCTDPCAGIGTPTWLSNKRIAFVRVVGPFDPDTGNAASAVLYSARIDGTDVRRLSEPGIDGVYEDNFARLSADRRFLTFLRWRVTDSKMALFRMNLDGSHVRQLTPWDLNAGLYDLSTARSGPTKNLIVFQTQGRGDSTQTWIDMGFVPATCASVSDCTSKIVWMTDNGATGRRTSNPQWSPDGSNLVFADRSSIEEPNVEIWTAKFGDRESQWRKISSSPLFDYRPAWGRSHAHYR